MMSKTEVPDIPTFEPRVNGQYYRVIRVIPHDKYISMGWTSYPVCQVRRYTYGYLPN